MSEPNPQPWQLPSSTTQLTADTTSTPQSTATNDASAGGQAPVLHALEVYLGRLVELVEGSNNVGGNNNNAFATATPTRLPQENAKENAQVTSSQDPTTTNATDPGWLRNEGRPPDTALPSDTDKIEMLSEAAGAEKFLRELELLIKCFLNQQQIIKTPEQLTGQHNLEEEATRNIPNLALQEETQARVEVLRRAMEAADATAAAKEMENHRSQEQGAREQFDEQEACYSFDPEPEQESYYNNLYDNRQIMEDIDHHWDATLAENDALKSELEQTATEQDELLVAKKAETDALKSQLVQATEQEARLAEAKSIAEQLLQQKDELLGKIKQAATDLKDELAGRHKQERPTQTERCEPTNQQVPRDTQPSPTLHQEKEVLLQRLRQSISELENELNWIQQEQQHLGENQQRTQQALQAHQELHQKLEKSSRPTESEIEATRQLLDQVHARTPVNTDNANSPMAGFGGEQAPMLTAQASQQEHAPPRVETVDEQEWQRDEQSAAMANASHDYWQQAAQQQLAMYGMQEHRHIPKVGGHWNYDPPTEYQSQGGASTFIEGAVYYPAAGPSHGSQLMSQSNTITPQQPEPSVLTESYSYGGVEQQSNKTNPGQAQTEAYNWSHMDRPPVNHQVTPLEYVGSRAYMQQQQQQQQQRQQPPPPQQQQHVKNYFVEIPTESTLTSGTDIGNVYAQRPSGMSLLQQQMSNAVEEAKHNALTVPTMPSSPYAPLPSGQKFPLQPAPAAPTSTFRTRGISPERLAPHRENGRSLGAPPTARMPNVVAQPPLLHQTSVPMRQHTKPHSQPPNSYLARVENGLNSPPRGWSTRAPNPFPKYPASSAGTPTHSNRTSRPPMNRIRLDPT